MSHLANIDNILRACFLSKITVELVSLPGLGKTSKITQWAEDTGKRLKKPFGVCVRHLAVEDPVEVAGVSFISKRHIMGEDRETTVRSYPSLFPQPHEFPGGVIPKFGVILLDEFRQAPHDTQKPAARLIDEGKLGAYDLKDLGHWSVIMASNRSSDRSGANRELAFITNRKMVLELDPNADALADWMGTNGYDPLAIGFVRAFPGTVFTDKVPSHQNPFCTPRSFCRAITFATAMGGNKGSLDVSPATVEGVAGLIGEGAAAEFMGYMRRVEDMVTVEEIIKSPLTARVPDRFDVQWAVVQTMIHHANKENAVAMFEYVKRLPKEFQTTAVRSMVGKVKDLMFESSYSAWLTDNQELVMAALASDPSKM